MIIPLCSSFYCTGVCKSVDGEEVPPPRPPSPVFAKILRISGRKNCRETIFALENGIFRRKNRFVPTVHAAGHDWRLERVLTLSSSPRFFDGEMGCGLFKPQPISLKGQGLTKMYRSLAGRRLFVRAADNFCISRGSRGASRCRTDTSAYLPRSAGRFRR